MRKTTFIVVIALTFVLCFVAAAQTKTDKYTKLAPIDEYLMDRDTEIAMALSAAPPEIAKEASVLVLTRKGYEKAVEGKNGFVCLVERGWTAPFDDPEFWNPKGHAPMCLNAQAARSALPVNLKRTELALSGLSREEIVAKLKEAIARKEFPSPEIGSMSYMLSKQEYNPNINNHWHPHLMFYMPGDMNASAWGANLPSGAVYGGGSDLPNGGRLPWTLFLVPVPRWSDGTPDEGHHKMEE